MYSYHNDYIILKSLFVPIVKKIMDDFFKGLTKLVKIVKHIKFFDIVIIQAPAIISA